MDPEVNYHRTFLDPWAIYGGHIPVWVSPQIMAGDRGVHTAYTVRNRHLVQILIREKSDQNFILYSTAWELQWSRLVFASRSLTPLVNDSLTVIGYCDWVKETDIFVPATAPFELKECLERGYEVVVASGNAKPGYRVFGVSERAQMLIIDIHGRVLASNGSRNEGFVQAEWITPLDLIEGVKLVVSLTGALRGKIVATLASRFSKSVPGGVFRELTQEELQAVQGGSRTPTRTLVVGRGAKTTRSAIPDIGTPETMDYSAANQPDWHTRLEQALQKYPQLRGQFGDVFVERIGINPVVSDLSTTGFTSAGVETARDLLGPGGTLRILQNRQGMATLDEVEKDIRNMLSADFMITKVERHPEGLLVTATKK